jgi:hypothetical protein
MLLFNNSLSGRAGLNQVLCLMAGCASHMKTDFSFRIGQQNLLHRTIFTRHIKVFVVSKYFHLNQSVYESWQISKVKLAGKLQTMIHDCAGLTLNPKP